MIKKLNAMSEIESVKFINRLAIGILLLFLFAYLFLAVFRAPTADETLYLLETLLMSKLISNGEWIGNYGVGVHGFLFKLPVALLFLVTGPSIFVATVFNIFLWVGAGWLFYKSLCRFFENRWWALAGLFLFFASLDPRLAPTFLREHALILCTVLLIGAVLDRRKGWLIGLYVMENVHLRCRRFNTAMEKYD